MDTFGAIVGFWISVLQMVLFEDIFLSSRGIEHLLKIL